MEQKNKYELIQLILGVRKLYQQHEKELRLLNYLCTPTKKNVEEYYFYVYQRDKRNPELYCSYTKKQNCLQKGMSKIKDFVIGIALDENLGYCMKDSNDIYSIEGTYGKKFPVEIKNSITFGNMATELLNSEFVQKIKLEQANEFGHIRSCDEKSILSFSQSNIIFTKYKSTYPNIQLDCGVNYYINTDTILLMSFDEKLSNKKISEALKVEFESSKLDKYHLDSVTTSTILEKPIFEEKIKPCYEIEYEIKEEERVVLLKKKK